MYLSLDLFVSLSFPKVPLVDFVYSCFLYILIFSGVFKLMMDPGIKSETFGLVTSDSVVVYSKWMCLRFWNRQYKI